MIEDRSPFKIYVDRLRNGRDEDIEEILSPEFLDFNEEDVHFEDRIKIQGNAAVVDETLVLRLGIETQMVIACCICNEKVKVPVGPITFLHIEPLVAIKSAIFDFKEVLREAILLEIPQKSECNQGNCPERELIKKYFSKSKE